MTEPHLLSPATALQYIRGGHGRATLVGKTHRFTYSFSAPEDTGRPIFVRALVGPDNTSDYSYIGAIYSDEESGTLVLVAGRKGRPDAPAFEALQWWLRAAQRRPEGKAMRQCQFWHEGVCCRCGRPLTTPESIVAGIGPVCATKER